MCAAVWRLPTDFDDVQSSEDQSSHRCMELVCRLEPGDYGDMKRSDQGVQCTRVFLVNVLVL